MLLLVEVMHRGCYIDICVEMDLPCTALLRVLDSGNFDTSPHAILQNKPEHDYRFSLF